ncbi:MAG TPA: hypothetical protein VGR28_07870 [Candidatus Thermoplasmatota archaeon]|nr:hypothetical protein [Candidatus Thermoplasmatota archaeon]
MKSTEEFIASLEQMQYDASWPWEKLMIRWERRQRRRAQRAD